MPHSKNIYLIGFMGSGKSTVGPLLASALKKNFIDLDEYIEESQHKSIADIFREHGEIGFRKIEAIALKTLASKSNMVIATGGGTPCHKVNSVILASGVTIYIQCTLRTLTDRLYSDREHRPLLNHCHTKRILYSFIRDKLNERKMCYEKSHLKVKNNLSPKILLISILQLIS